MNDEDVKPKRKPGRPKKSTTTKSQPKRTPGRPKKEDEKPFSLVKSIVYDNSGIKIEMDWNDAFIKYLRDNGITGVDDNAVIQKYLLSLSADIASNLEVTQSNEFE